MGRFSTNGVRLHKLRRPGPANRLSARTTRLCGPGRGERSSPPPLGTPPAACPLTRRGAVARDAPLRTARATSPQNPRRRRIGAGDSVGMPARAGLRESGAPHRSPGRIGFQAEQGRLASAADRRASETSDSYRASQWKRGASRLVRTVCRTTHSSAGCHSPPPMSKKPRKPPLDRRQIRRRGRGSAIAAPGAQPQERRRTCTRTQRRRRRSGWTGP